jgi:hypothetical protein
LPLRSSRMRAAASAGARLETSCRGAFGNVPPGLNETSTFAPLSQITLQGFPRDFGNGAVLVVSGCLYLRRQGTRKREFGVVAGLHGNALLTNEAAPGGLSCQ